MSWLTKTLGIDKAKKQSKAFAQLVDGIESLLPKEGKELADAVDSLIKQTDWAAIGDTGKQQLIESLLAGLTNLAKAIRTRGEQLKIPAEYLDWYDAEYKYQLSQIVKTLSRLKI